MVEGGEGNPLSEPQEAVEELEVKSPDLTEEEEEEVVVRG